MLPPRQRLRVESALYRCCSKPGRSPLNVAPPFCGEHGRVGSHQVAAALREAEVGPGVERHEHSAITQHHDVGHGDSRQGHRTLEGASVVGGAMQTRASIEVARHVDPTRSRPRGVIDRDGDAVVATSQPGRREPAPPAILGAIHRHALPEADLQRRAFGSERDLRIERAEIGIFGKPCVVPGEPAIERRVGLVDVSALRESQGDRGRDEIAWVSRVDGDSGFDVGNVAVSSHEYVRPDGNANWSSRLAQGHRARGEQDDGERSVHED